MPAFNAVALALDGLGGLVVTGDVQFGPTEYQIATTKLALANGFPIWPPVLYNGPGQIDNAWDVAVDDNGNVVVTGEGTLAGDNTKSEYVTIKYDANGSELWASRFTDPSLQTNRPAAVAVASTGDVYVTGKSTFQAGGSQMAIVKYHGATGAITGPLEVSATREGRDIAVDGGGNIIAVGVSDAISDFFVIKVDSDLTEPWRATHDEGDSEEAFDVEIDAEGNVYAFGTSSSAQPGYLTVKYNSSGGEQWSQTFLGNEFVDLPDEPVGMALGIGGDVYVTGTSLAIATGNDIVTIKYEQAAVDNTPPGNSVVVQPLDQDNNAPVTLTFDQVDVSGETSLTTSPNGPAEPPGFILSSPVNSC